MSDDANAPRTAYTRRAVLKLGGQGLISAVGAAVLAQMNAALPAQAQEIDIKADVNLARRIYLAPDDHTDLLWAGTEEQYQAAFLEMLDYYLDLADTTRLLAAEYQSRWHCDGSYWLWMYEQNRPPEQFNRLIERIRDGHITAPLNTLVVCHGSVPAEAVLRGMFYAGKLERRHNLRFPLALAMENHTLPYGLGALWAGAGAKYTWKGVRGANTRLQDLDKRPHEIYWWVGPDDSRLLMKWHSIFLKSIQAGTPAETIGSYAEMRFAEQVVAFADTSSEFQAAYPYRVIGLFGKGQDSLKTLSNELPDLAARLTTPARRVIVSNLVDFFEDFITEHGEQLPSVAASYGNEWELYSAALAEVSASVKRATEKLRAAEALAALVTYQRPDFMTFYREAAATAWRSLGLYWEHNFGVVGKLEQYGAARIAWQRRLAAQIAAYVDTLHTAAARRLGDFIARVAETSFYVFNPLSWERTDYADWPYDGSPNIHVIDQTTGQAVPFQFIARASQTYLRILASAVPALGYKVYEVRPERGDPWPDAASVTGNVFENEYYRVEVSPWGSLVSVIARQQGSRELVRVVDGLGWNDLGTSTGGSGSIEHAGAVSVTLLLRAPQPLNHETRVTLWRGIDRIDIDNTVLQGFGDTRVWTFNFNLDNPDVWHEEMGAIIRARLISADGHYATSHARYDWLTLNHFASISGSDGAGVTLANADAYFMKLGASTPNRLDTATPRISVLLGCRDEGGIPDSGIPDQGGDTVFRQRFGLRAHAAFAAPAAMRFGLEQQNPFVTGTITGAGAAYPPGQYQFIAINQPDVLLWALKPAEDQPDTTLVARVWNLAAEAREFTLTFPQHRIQAAEFITHIETPIASAPVDVNQMTDTLNKQQLKSYSIMLE